MSAAVRPRRRGGHGHRGGEQAGPPQSANGQVEQSPSGEGGGPGQYVLLSLFCLSFPPGRRELRHQLAGISQ